MLQIPPELYDTISVGHPQCVYSLYRIGDIEGQQPQDHKGGYIGVWWRASDTTQDIVYVL